MIKLHNIYSNLNNLMRTTVASYQKKMAKFSTQRMSSEAHYSGGSSQLDEYFRDQLLNGQVLLDTETKTRKLQDSTIKTYIEVNERTDENGNILRGDAEVIDLGLKATYSSLDNVLYTPRIYEKLKAKIDAASDEATAKQKLITAQQEALTVKAQGERLIAETKAREEADELQDVIRARKAKLVAAENLEQAKLDAASTLALKKAEAEGDKLKVLAGLSPKERADIEKQTAIGVAAELAKVKFPDEMIIVGGSGSNGGDVNPFTAVGLESFYNLSKKMSKKK